MSKTNDVIDVFCVSESTVPREYGEAADGAELSWRTLLSADRTPTRGLAAAKNG